MYDRVVLGDLHYSIIQLREEVLGGMEIRVL